MYFEVDKLKESFGLYFWRLNDEEKGMTKAFRCYKLTSKMCLVYLDVKL